MTIHTVYVTAPSRESARSIAAALIEERLVACANILPGVESMYRWQGAVENDDEVAVIFKTSERTLERTLERIVELHEYEVPCVTSWPVAHGHAAYLSWVEEECAPSSDRD